MNEVAVRAWQGTLAFVLSVLLVPTAGSADERRINVHQQRVDKYTIGARLDIEQSPLIPDARRSHFLKAPDGAFAVITNDDGVIESVKISAGAWTFEDTQVPWPVLVKPGTSSLGDMLELYGTPQEVRVDKHQVHLEYADGIDFSFNSLESDSRHGELWKSTLSEIVLKRGTDFDKAGRTPHLSPSQAWGELPVWLDASERSLPAIYQDVAARVRAKRNGR